MSRPTEQIVIHVTPELRDLIMRVREWDVESSAELDEMTAEAERTCNYYDRDSYATDMGEQAREYLGAFLAYLKEVK